LVTYVLAACALVLSGCAREEQMMLQAFGGGYVAYAGRTKRIIPGVF
jgi:protein-S-isoprenylcysteine O-methyltransferase Ste14